MTPRTPGTDATLVAPRRRHTSTPRAATAAWKNAPEVAGPFRVAGLDGVRAVAVALVILFHLSPGAFIGGYLGVDVFFVVSGYLITTLLVRERAEFGRIALGAFWARRARRLLPALGIVALVCGSAAALLGGDVLVGLGRQVLGAASFSSNWLMIAAGSSYFDDSLPELFRNLWSLAVEEQFYLIWPLLLVAAAAVTVRAKWMPRRAGLIATVLLATASALAMALLWTPTDATRVYYGTDTHAFGLGIGAALAVVAVSWPRRALEWPRAARAALGVTGALALLGLIVLAATVPGDTALVFRGGLVLVTVLTALVIAALLVPGTALAGLLGLGAFRWVGTRSYGLYLWHWPVFVLVAAALPGWSREGASGWALGGIALAITVVASALSYRFVEQPVRRDGFRHTLRRVWRGCRASLPRAVAAAVVAAIVLVGVSGTAVAVSSDPGVSETQLAIEAGQRAIREAASSPIPTPAMTDGVSADATPSAAQTGPAVGPGVTAIGDSVMLAAAPALVQRFPGISIDAAVSRRLPAAIDVVRADLAAGTLRSVVVVGLATNGPIERSTLEQLRTDIGRSRQLVVITAQAPRGWTDPNNAILTEFADGHRNVALADWHGAAQPILGILNRDQIHFGPTGARVYTDIVDAALTQLAAPPQFEADRADRPPADLRR